MYTCPTGIFLYTIQPYDTLWLLARRYHTNVAAIKSLNPGMNLNYLQIGQVIRICPNYYPQSNHISSKISANISKAQLNLSNYMRMLWEQHVTWTRLTIISIIENLPDEELVTNRLLRNPIDFKIALQPLYGDKIASRFADLFKDHLVIAAQLVKAAKAGDNKAAADAENRWYKNADEIAAFLGSINPYWSQKDWMDMLHEHLALTKSEAVNILTKNYKNGIAVYDDIELQALKMADTMTEGIIKQFPDRFK